MNNTYELYEGCANGCTSCQYKEYCYDEIIEESEMNVAC
jgi:hypothetical protein